MRELIAMVDDPVAQRLPPRAFRLLVNLMAMAEGGPLPDRRRIGWRLHLSPDALARDLAPLVAAGLAGGDAEHILLVREAAHGAAESVQTGCPAVPSCPPLGDHDGTEGTTAATHDESPAGRKSEGSRRRTRAWRARRRATATAQPRLPLFSVVASTAGQIVAGDAVTRCDVTGDGVTPGDASPPSPGVTHEHVQRLTSVTGDASRVTPPVTAGESLFKTPDLKKETQTLARGGDAVTGDASPVTVRTEIAAARAAFDRFRARYPKPPESDPRKPAEQAFLALVLRERVDPDRILSAAARYAEQVRRDRTEPRFIPASARWLRERRFDDIAEAAGPPARAALSPAGTDPWLAPVLSRLEAEIGADLVASWFSQLAVLRRDGDRIVLSAPTRFLADAIEARHGDRLRAAIMVAHGIERVTVVHQAVPAAKRARAPP